MVLTLTDQLDKIYDEFPNSICIKYKKENVLLNYTYAQIHEASLKVATWISCLGFSKKDRAVLILENQPEWPIIYFGILYSGMTCVPLDTQLSPIEIANLLKDSCAKVIFCSRKIFFEKISKSIQPDVHKIVVLDNQAQDFNDEKLVSYSRVKDIQVNREKLPRVLPDDWASIIYTSGTTGIPKGVLLTHRNLYSNFKSINKLGLTDKRDNFIVLLPLHHTYPCMISLILPLLIGATVTFPPTGFKPDELGAIMNEADVTILVGVPQLFSLIHFAILEKIKSIPFFLRPFIGYFFRNKIKERLGRGLKYMLSGGARLDPIVARRLTKIGFNIIEGYGLTETSPVVSFNLPGKIKFGSVGTPIPDVDIKIEEANSDGIGKVLIKGPNVMQGYFNNSEMTASVIHNGWFYSGDLGYMDSEGYLFLTGREKEVIVLSSGKNIYPEELEEHYQKSPFIKELCIMEKEISRNRNDAVALYSVIVPDVDYFKKIGEGNIQSKVRWELENLAKDIPAYKHIMGFKLTKDSLPRTSLRKLKRYKIKEMYLSRIDKNEAGSEISDMKETPETDLELLGLDISKKVMNYLYKKFKKTIKLSSHLEIDLGIDSLTRVEVGIELEKMFAINIKDEYLFRFVTVKDIICMLNDLIKKKEYFGYNESVNKEIIWDRILKEIPSSDIRKKIRLNPTIFDWILMFLVRYSVFLLFKIFWRIKTHKYEFLKKNGPYVITPNHNSYLDGFAIACCLPTDVIMNTFFIGYNAILNHPLVSWLHKIARLIPINSNANFIDAMQAVSYVLSHNKIVCFFPEGERSIDGNVKKFKPGIGILMKELNIPAVPVFIKGTYEAWPRGRRFPIIHPIKVVFGKFFTKKSLIHKAEKSGIIEYDEIADKMREEVNKLES